MRSNYPAETRTQQVRRRDIIDAAVKVINTQGYASASIMAIATAAHASKGTVMYHFGSKEELISAVVRTAYGDGAAYMKPRIDAAASMAEKLRAYITSNLEYIASHAQQIAAVHQIMLNTPFVDYSGNAVDLLQQLFLRGQADGEFCQFDARVMAVSLRQIIDGSSFYILANPGLDTDTYAHSICLMFHRATTK